MEFLIGTGIYFAIGLLLTPFFTRCIFNDEIDKDRYDSSSGYARRYAKKSAGMAYAQSLGWPVFLFIHYNMYLVLRNLDKYHDLKHQLAENEKKQKEADRIVAEYKKEHSWEARFKKLEAETKQKLINQ